MASWWQAVLDVIYPPRCPGCKQEVITHGRWCPACLKQLLAVREINCQAHHLRYLDGCLTLSEYRGSVKRLIHAMKFQRKEEYAPHLRRLLEEGRVAQRLCEVDGVLPVPLSAERIKERGYNQVTAIFQEWAKERKLPWLEGLLARQKNTLPQWELSLAERHKNIKDAFMLTRPKDVYVYKSLLLVDDIITTGVTLDECARILKQAGVLKVYALTIAAGAKE